MPLAVLKLEFIGENYFAYKRSGANHEATECYGHYLGHDHSRPCVKYIRGYNEDYGFLSEEVRGQIDYSRANSTGSRGVFLYFPLKDGVYEVTERVTWTRVRRYFLFVEKNDYVEVTEKEVLAWLNAKDESQ